MVYAKIQNINNPITGVTTFLFLSISWNTLYSLTYTEHLTYTENDILYHITHLVSPTLTHCNITFYRTNGLTTYYTYMNDFR